MEISKFKPPSFNVDGLFATRLAEVDRRYFLPALFGNERMDIGEALVYFWMGILSKDYRGGRWDYYRTSNAAMYLAPQRPKILRISVVSNGFVGKLSADAAGIVATIYALRQLGIQSREQLIEFSTFHPEAGSIFNALT